MVGGRITSEERSTLSTYIGLGVVTVLAAWAVYFFLVSHQEKKEVTVSIRIGRWRTTRL